MKRIAIALALTAAICCSAQNLVRNADFRQVTEKGKLVSWNDKVQAFTRVDSDQPGKTEEKAVMTKVTMPKEGKTTRSSMSQKITLAPGKYLLTFTAKVVGDGYANCSWNNFTEEEKLIKVPKCWTPACSGPEWKTITHVLVIPEGTAFIYLSLTGYLSASEKHKEGAMYFSGISLTPIDGGRKAKSK